MKIRLERKLISCPHKISCVACRQKFEVPKIRALLYSDQNLIQGDVCPDCVRLKPHMFQQKIQEHADRLVLQARAYPEQSTISQDHAIELLEAAQEPISFPNLIHWFLAKIAIFSEESQELEAARFGGDRCHCHGRIVP